MKSHQPAQVTQIPHDHPEQVAAFVALEAKFLGSQPRYVSPIFSEIARLLSGRSPFYRWMDHALFVVSGENGPSARVAAFVNTAYQEAKREKTGFLGYFAAQPRAALPVQALLRHAETWLQERQVTRLVAPYHGTGILGFGLRTAAFDEDPVFPFEWHPPYYRDYFQAAGYQPSYPIWFYSLPFASPRYQSAKAMALSNTNVAVRPLRMDAWDEDLEIFRELFNQGFQEEWEFHPYSAPEFRAFFNVLKRTPAGKLMLLAEVDGQPAGFCWGMPDWTPLFRSFRGKMGPFQIFRLMLAAGKYRHAGLLGIGVLPAFRRHGVGRKLAVTLFEMYARRGISEAAYYSVNETNLGSKAFIEKLGGQGRVLYHCFDKTLSP